MAVASESEQVVSDGAYRCLGSLTIARVASTERELAETPDPLTIDLSGVKRMDTVGAWLIHRPIRDRGPRIVGARPDPADLKSEARRVGRGCGRTGRSRGG